VHLGATLAQMSSGARAEIPFRAPRERDNQEDDALLRRYLERIPVDRGDDEEAFERWSTRRRLSLIPR